MAVVGAGGWLGFSFYAKHRVTAEVETAFEQIRKQGGKASYGKIAFDLPTRTLTIEDIAVTPGKAPQAQIRIAAIKGTGVRQIDETRISADAVDITGLEVTLDQIGAAKLKVAYKIPHLVMRDYAGPVQAGQVPADSSLVDMYRYVLGQYASVAASSLTAPTLTISFDSRAAGSGEVTYSELAIQNLKHGKIDGMKSDRAVISVDVKQPGKTDKLTGESSNIIVNDFDATAIIAALDPQTASDDSYRRVYRQVSTAPMRSNRHRGCEWMSTGSPWKTSPSSRRNSGWPRYLPRCHGINRPRRLRRRHASCWRSSPEFMRVFASVRPKSARCRSAGKERPRLVPSDFATASSRSKASTRRLRRDSSRWSALR